MLSTEPAHRSELQIVQGRTFDPRITTHRQLQQRSAVTVQRAQQKFYLVTELLNEFTKLKRGLPSKVRPLTLTHPLSLYTATTYSCVPEDGAIVSYSGLHEPWDVAHQEDWIWADLHQDESVAVQHSQRLPSVGADYPGGR